MKRFAVLLSMFLLITLDQLTKFLAYHFLRGNDPVVLIHGVFELRYLENRGAAFGMMQNQIWFFVAGTVIFLLVAGVLFVKLAKRPKLRFLLWLLALICSGAIGNMIDRLVRGFVVDFFYFSLINFPIFNMADCYVTVAVALLIFLLFFYFKEEDLEEIWKNKKE